MNEPRLKILPPWSITIKKIEALFDGDPQIACNVTWDSVNPSITLACNNGDKVAALLQILPEEFEYGNVKLKVFVDGVPSNIAFKNKKELFETVFHGNPAFAYAVSPADDGYWFLDVVYIVFKNVVVQYFSDNLNDCHGLTSTLYQDIAADIFESVGLNGVYYCTDVERGNLGKPLGEWP